MDEDQVIVRCPACGAKNRVKRNVGGQRPVCGKCRSPLPVPESGGKPVTVTDRNFQQEVLSSPLPVLVDCWAPWCGPCRMVGPTVDQLASDYPGRLKVAKLNVDENPGTASRYGIRSIPTLLVFNNGEKFDTIVGAVPRQEIEKRLTSVL